MTLKYYHAEPVANSLKSMIPLVEKGLPFQSVYVDLHKFEQHADWFVAINPEGQVPVLDHDGTIITHTTVINEYLEDVFPDIPLRPRDPVGAASMLRRNLLIYGLGGIAVPFVGIKLIDLFVTAVGLV